MHRPTHHRRIRRLVLIIAGTVFGLMGKPALFAQAQGKLKLDGYIPNPTVLANKDTDLLLMNGVIVNGTRVTAFESDRRSQGIKFVKYLDRSRRVTKKVEDVYRLKVEGKAMVALFSNRSKYGEFETQMMDNPNFGTSTIVYHTKTDKFLVACHGDEMTPKLVRKISWVVAGGVRWKVPFQCNYS